MILTPNVRIFRLPLITVTDIGEYRVSPAPMRCRSTHLVDLSSGSLYWI